ncbi:Serine/Threonine-kinase [Medicago truncatula]|uniref:Serine/Threonine-kinase n=1 Tax=Medicago truncatula TaxID=3880 RepID=A0A072TS08_MEDTR|nr:Serine/Threonine-kinase [Medicago truncatula]
MDGNVPTCECVKGYVPKFPQQWQISYQSNGFLRYCKMKFPDTSSSWFSKIMDLEECRTCSAYANLDICGRGSVDRCLPSMLYVEVSRCNRMSLVME